MDNRTPYSYEPQHHRARQNSGNSEESPSTRPVSASASASELLPSASSDHHQPAVAVPAVRLNDGPPLVQRRQQHMAMLQPGPSAETTKNVATGNIGAAYGPYAVSLGPCSLVLPILTHSDAVRERTAAHGAELRPPAPASLAHGAVLRPLPAPRPTTTTAPGARADPPAQVHDRGADRERVRRRAQGAQAQEKRSAHDERRARHRLGRRRQGHGRLVRGDRPRARSRGVSCWVPRALRLRLRLFLYSGTIFQTMDGRFSR